MNTITRRARIAGAIAAGGLVAVAGAAAVSAVTRSAAPETGRVPSPIAMVAAGVRSHPRFAPVQTLSSAHRHDAAGSAPPAPVGLVASTGHYTSTRGTGPAAGAGPGTRSRQASPALPTAHPSLSPARLVAGAGPLPSGWVATAHDITVGGLSRVYLTVRPEQVTGHPPVVVLLPGRDMSPDGVLRISDLADRIGPAVIIVPAGWDEFWNAGDCCGAAYLHHIDDVAFIHDAVGAVVSSTPALSASPVYAVGFSNGGRLTYHLACELPGVFTGIMAVEAVPVETCPSMTPLDVTVVAQQADPLLTVDAGAPPKTIGGFVEPTVAATVSHLAGLDHCRGPATVSDVGSAVERTWTCARGIRLRYIWYPGGSHSWRPPTAATPGATDFVLQMLGRSYPTGAPSSSGAGVARPGAALTPAVAGNPTPRGTPTA